MLLGTLGFLTHVRCQACGAQFSFKVRAKRVRRNPRGRYYLDGYQRGAEAAKVNIQEEPESLAKYASKDRLGEYVGELREHQVQFEGDISYDVGRGVTEKQYESWEEGFAHGFFKAVEKWLVGYRPVQSQRTLMNRRR